MPLGVESADCILVVKPQPPTTGGRGSNREEGRALLDVLLAKGMKDGRVVAGEVRTRACQLEPGL